MSSHEGWPKHIGNNSQHTVTEDMYIHNNNKMTMNNTHSRAIMQTLRPYSALVHT